MLLAVMEYIPYRPGDENIALTVGRGGEISIDFNGNGQKDFADFLLFVQNFGLNRDDTSYQRHFDLNGDGHINLPTSSSSPTNMRHKKKAPEEHISRSFTHRLYFSYFSKLTTPSSKTSKCISRDR